MGEAFARSTALAAVALLNHVKDSSPRLEVLGSPFRSTRKKHRENVNRAFSLTRNKQKSHRETARNKVHFFNEY